MKMTLNRLSVLVAAGILTVILVSLSIFYFQNRSELVSAPKTSEKSPKKEYVEKKKVPRPKLTPEEKEQKLLEREAKRTGQDTEKLREAEQNPTNQIQREMERVAEVAPEEAMSDLVGKKRRLEKMGTEKVEEISDFIGKKMNLESTRETEVRQTVTPDKFDADTAQIADCRREETEDGKFRYMAQLVDAQGNAMEVELHGAEAEQTWRTMKMVKSSPLMEALYRGSVMPLLDRKMTGEKEEREEREEREEKEVKTE